MNDIIAEVEIPETAAVAEATRFLRETTGPLLFHHSRRVFLFASLHARKLGLQPDPELLYISAMFHDTGLSTPFSDEEQRFELDGADHARKFLLDRGFSAGAAEIVWTTIALHTTPGIPGRMGPETASMNFGVLTDVLGWGLDGLDGGEVEEIVAAHPRGEFKTEFLRAFVDGLRNRPDTTYGTVNSDVLEHFVPGFRRTTMVERIMDAPWPK
ncbi:MULTISPECIES: HD domain-containing protein [unclassified Streptomyces]|uniref:HD domain-containing protein n=1 Tax=unclassified Streptomyces TaxID=2593676 RepID=UPI0011CD88EB|nr:MULTISPECIES: HD domain-containing protein [unclassified Streptomyces]TXS61165.1 HD domain-containing protein [Streptomyces sp. me109]